MRDKKRIKPFLEKLEKLWLESPDLRFGQLVYDIMGQHYIEELFYMEDEKFEELLKKFSAEYILDPNKEGF